MPTPAGPCVRRVGKDMPIKQAEHTGSSFACTTVHRTVRREEEAADANANGSTGTCPSSRHSSFADQASGAATTVPEGAFAPTAVPKSESVRSCMSSRVLSCLMKYGLPVVATYQVTDSPFPDSTTGTAD